MKLVTYQKLEAIKDLFNKGYLECNSKNINLDKYGYVYDYIMEKMNYKINNKHNTKYPIWCWVKCYNGINPPKRKGNNDLVYAKITFKKNKNEVFITDYRRYSFLLNNMYIPKNKKDKEEFDKKLKEYNITRDDLKSYIRNNNYKKTNNKDLINISKEIRNSFDRCISTNSNILQGCVYRINVNEIEKIEIINNDGYIHGSLDYIRSNGKRFDWIEDYYKKL